LQKRLKILLPNSPFINMSRSKYEAGQSPSKSRRETRRRMRWVARRENAANSTNPSLPASADVVVIERKKLTPLQRRVRGFLAAVYERGQKEKTERAVSESIADRYGMGGRRLISAFGKSQDFAGFYELAKAEIRKGSSGNDERKFRGALFASIAWAYLRETQDDPTKVLVSPQDTFKLAQMVNPDSQPIESAYGEMGLDGRYVPDFLLLGTQDGQVVIEKFGEISLSSDPDKYAPQIKGFSLLKSKLGLLAKPSRFSIVSTNAGPPLEILAAAGIELVDVDPIPLSIWDFNSFALRIQREYRSSPDSLSLAQLRIEAKAQIAQIKRIGEPQFFIK